MLVQTRERSNGDSGRDIEDSIDHDAILHETSGMCIWAQREDNATVGQEEDVLNLRRNLNYLKGVGQEDRQRDTMPGPPVAGWGGGGVGAAKYHPHELIAAQQAPQIITPFPVHQDVN